MTTEAATKPRRGAFRYCLNTSTIQGQKQTLPQIVDIAARAGYDAIEPWISEIESFVAGGGSLSDLRKRIHDGGMTVESGIGFAEWIVDDDARRAKGMEVAKRDLDLLSQLGGKHLAAPPAGAIDQPHLDLRKAAERYRALADLGDQFNVIPMVEVWGFSQLLTKLGDAALVAIESGHPRACVLADAYHLYKGGSDINGLRLLRANAVPHFHINDFPAIPRDKITDADRVYPGDGIGPLPAIFKILHEISYTGTLSIELFNKGYWAQDAYTVAKTALDKTRAIAERSVT